MLPRMHVSRPTRIHRSSRLNSPSPLRFLFWALFTAIVFAASPLRGGQPAASKAAVRRFCDSIHGEIIAVDLGRMVYRKRWQALLADGLYLIAPRGAWNEASPTWAASQRAFEKTLIKKSAEWLAANREEVRLIVYEQSGQALSEDELRLAAEFFESAGGRVWRDRRERLIRERVYGLPFIIERDPLAQIKAENLVLEKALLELPEDGDGKAVYDFFQSSVGEKVLHLENEIWAPILANVFGSELDAIVTRDAIELAKALRSEVPSIPPQSIKTYLGSVVMGADRSLEIEHYQAARLIGTYKLKYNPDEAHWSDVAAAVPGINPGDKRFLYRDPLGGLSDQP
jgi:hypothetical protein